jgi:transposase
VLSQLLPEKIRRDEAQRKQAIYDAHVTYGDTLREIADHLGVHYTTVSRVMNDGKREI